MAIPSIFIVSDNIDVLPEFCAGARSLAQSVTAFVFGDETAAAEAAACGADRLIYCLVSEEEAPEDYAKAIADTIRSAPEAIVLVNNSIRGRCLAGKLSVYLDTAVLTNATELTEEDGVLTARRVVYGGTAQRRERFTGAYGVITISAGLFEAEPEAAPTADIAPIAGAPEGTLRRISRKEKKEGAVNLAAAKRIVDVGRGLVKEEDLEMCRSLAKTLGAEVGCSRPVAENNKWMPKNCYMGITGVQVKPELILALGVSGQVQHIGGINKAKVIVAVNKDKAAPIFKNCDFGLVGDMYKIVPALIEKLS